MPIWLHHSIIMHLLGMFVLVCLLAALCLLVVMRPKCSIDLLEKQQEEELVVDTQKMELSKLKAMLLMD